MKLITLFGNRSANKQSEPDSISTKAPSILKKIQDTARLLDVNPPQTLWHESAPWSTVQRDSTWTEHFRQGLEELGFTPTQIEGAVRSSLYRSNQAKQFYWDQSPGHWDLLLRFHECPSTAVQAAASYLGDWNELLEEPLQKAIDGLCEAGLLQAVNDPAILLRCWLDHRGVQALCRSRKLRSGGNTPALIIRLLEADPGILSSIPQGDTVYEVTQKGRECLAGWYGW